MITLALIVALIVVVGAVAGLMNVMMKSYLNWFCFQSSMDGLLKLVGVILTAIVQQNE